MFKRLAGLGSRWAMMYLLLYVVNLPLGALVSRLAWWFLQVELVVPTFLGRADTAYNYGITSLRLILALVAALAWSVAVRWRDVDATYGRGLRVILRYWLAWNLIIYGWSKVLPVQFLALDLDRLLQPIGQTSPMGLMWTFMGASPAYSTFSGALELLAGILLFHRRTTLPGALLSLGLVCHILMLNLCYDLALKLFSLHLVLISLWLIGPDTRRLVAVLTGGQAAAATDLRWTLAHPGPVMALKVVVVAFMVLSPYFAMREAAETIASFQGPPALRGSWRVEGNGQPPNREVWQRVTMPRMSLLVTEDQWGKPTRYTAQFPANPGTKGLVRLSDWTRRDWTSSLRYHLVGDRLELSGDWNGEPMTLTLRRETLPEFPLQTRGFHWITERPFNL